MSGPITWLSEPGLAVTLPEPVPSENRLVGVTAKNGRELAVLKVNWVRLGLRPGKNVGSAETTCATSWVVPLPGFVKGVVASSGEGDPD